MLHDVPEGEPDQEGTDDELEMLMALQEDDEVPRSTGGSGSPAGVSDGSHPESGAGPKDGDGEDNLDLLLSLHDDLDMGDNPQAAPLEAAAGAAGPGAGRKPQGGAARAGRAPGGPSEGDASSCSVPMRCHSANSSRLSPALNLLLSCWVKLSWQPTAMHATAERRGRTGRSPDRSSSCSRASRSEIEPLLLLRLPRWALFPFMEPG